MANFRTQSSRHSAGRAWLACWLVLILPALARGGDWMSQVLPVELTVGYAVRCFDISNDGLLDIAIVDSKRILWLEAPDWKPHVVFETPTGKADNVCFAQHDIDGDGDQDLAIGFDWQPNNTKSGGAVGWLECPKEPRDPWTFHTIENTFPTVHRMQWLDLDGDGRSELVVAPLKGRNSTGPGFEDTGVELTQFSPKVIQGASSQPSVEWTSRVIDQSLHVMHNLHPFSTSSVDANLKKVSGQQDLLLASFEGVHWLTLDPTKSVQKTRLGSGFEGAAPAKGSSEVRLGMGPNKLSFLATIEPWHGFQVVVYEQPKDFRWAHGEHQDLWPRKVIDDQLKWGHAVACGNLDDDPEEELIIGVRDEQLPHRCGVRIYDRDSEGNWKRNAIEPGQVAVEDLVVADLDNDGTLEIIAVGRATKNAVIYRQKK